MTDLPPGWARATIGDLLLGIEAGKSFQCEARPAKPGEWGVIKVSAMTWGTFKETENKAVPADRAFNPAHEIKPGDILVSRANTSEYVGAPVLVGECRPRLLLSDKSLRLKPSHHVDRRWLLHLLSSPAIRRAISLRATGTKDSMRNISQQSLAEIEIMVPPLAEQHRIVATLEDYLSRLTSGDSLLKSAIRRANQFERVAADQAVRGFWAPRKASLESSGWDLLTEILQRRSKLTTGRRRQPSPPAYGERLRLPDHWAMASVDQLCWKIEYGSSAKAHKEAFPGDIPVVRMGNIQNGKIQMNDLKYLPAGHPDVNSLLLEDGDILFNRTNSAELVGKTAVYRTSLGPATFASYLIRCRLIDGIDPDWVGTVINSSIGRTYIGSVVTQQVGQANVNGTKLAAMPIPLPPWSEQQEIINALEHQRAGMERLQQEASTALKRSRHLRQSLLSDAFCGRMTPQDPRDEPASTIFERIPTANATPQLPHRRRSRQSALAPQEETLL